jgi:hypothetical protein
MPKKKKSKSSKKTAIFSDIQTQLKAINQKLDFVVVQLGLTDEDEEDPHPIVREALKSTDWLEKQ